ncbi:MAG TPA: SDR family NAD(P)-dependent oxidoreductase [Chitinophagales bacterium]|nr:SDR family NAD(P)-dependent oxidoreductase [Chitinophagales bacterium]
MGKTALITGATSGIGWATAEIFAENGIRLIVCGRRQERLDALKNKLKQKVRIHSLCFDVRDKSAVFRAIGSLPKNFSDIDVLVNNAGNAHGLSAIDEAETEDWDTMIDLNVKGLLYVFRAVVPGMVKRKNGHIINIGSIASREVYPKGNVYCATKFAVDALNQGMRHDLLEKGIRVTGIFPGAVETEFSLVRFKGDTERAKQVYKGFEPLTARDVAEAILFAVTRPPHVNISELTILPSAQASVQHIYKRQM